MSLQGTLNFGHGSDAPLYFVQNRFLTPIQIDIKIKMIGGNYGKQKVYRTGNAHTEK